MVNYNLGKNYKIVCDESDFVYIGSTCQLLSKRWYHHKKDHKHSKSKIYQYMNK